MLLVSLSLNLLVLIPVVAGLLRDAAWTGVAFGEGTAARGILTAVYGAILLCSFAALAFQLAGGKAVNTPALSLLAVQVIYKCLSALVVRDVHNPVIRSNLAIAAVHAITLSSAVIG